MKDFANYLVSKRFVTKKVSHFYRLWDIGLYAYIGKKPGETIENGMADKAGSRGNTTISVLFGVASNQIYRPKVVLLFRIIYRCFT